MTDRSPSELDRFIGGWGALASLFGFSPSTSRVSALLMASPQPLCLGEIADKLQISRGNASMCLKELRTWGVVRRISAPGDRRDFYEVGDDIWRMAISIARERKRREFDPVLRGTVDSLELLAESASPEHAERLSRVRDFLATFDRIGSQLLENEQAALALVGLLSGRPARPKP